MAQKDLLEKLSKLPPELIEKVESFVDMISEDKQTAWQPENRSYLFGALKGKIIIKDGFDDPIEGMEDYR